jgi:hypothetical protein
MKINEVVITEGVWDNLKAGYYGATGAVQGAAAGKGILGTVRGAVQGAKAGAAASTAKSQQQDLINRVAQKAIASWSTQSQSITASGKQLTPDDLAAWWKRYTKGQDTTGTDNPLPSNLNNNAAVVAWLNKEVAGYMAKKSMPADTAPAGLDTKSAAAGAEVDTPAQGKVTKREDGKWYNEQGQQIVNPKDVAELEKRFAGKGAAKGADQPAGDETVTIGGQKLNPKDPKDAALIAKLQGQLDQQKAQTQQPATAQQSAGTTIPEPTTATDGDVFAGDSQQAEEQTLPDVSQLTPEQRAELRKQLQAELGSAK